MLKKNINVRIEDIKELRGIEITFSKDNKHFRKMIYYDETPDIIIDLYISNLIKEAEKELDH